MQAPTVQLPPVQAEPLAAGCGSHTPLALHVDWPQTFELPQGEFAARLLATQAPAPSQRSAAQLLLSLPQGVFAGAGVATQRPAPSQVSAPLHSAPPLAVPQAV